ncbi:metalloendopeptidase CpaA [Lysobacter firmicutimachus]|uniref:Metalloendopeptidase CpaA n=1 Tax=Lysobacter firmicutimachus TaxID=1792846 RepID=A0AAU8MUM1_9GAMM
MKRPLLGVFAALIAFDVAATDLSPNAIGGGDIPGNYASIDFYLSKDDWAPTLTLPADAGDQATVTIHSSTGKLSNLIAGNTDYPLTSMTIAKDDHVSFVFQASQRRWTVVAPTYTPNGNGGSGAMPTPMTGKFARFNLADGDWSQAVTLPASAPDGSVIAVASSAVWTSRIAPTHALFASSFNLRTGDQYVFMYRSRYQSWVSVKTPVVALDAGSIPAQLPAPTVPTTQVRFADGNWSPSITLPASAGDRDRISLISDASWATTVSNQYLDTTATIKLTPGMRYDFLYIREKGLWTLQSAPAPSHRPDQLSNGQLPDMSSPKASLRAYDGNWSRQVLLPVNARPGDEIVVSSDASWAFDVTAANTAFGTIQIGNGDIVRFVRDDAGRWTRATRLISMLLAYSDRAVARVGESGEKMRLLEGLRLTNEALENSKANFYVKPAGFLRHQLPQASLGDALNAAQTDPVVLDTRARTAADAFYFEDYYGGTAASCGLGVITVTKREAMVGIGALECGTTVLRHELAHNLGIAHAYENNGATPYAKGYPLLPDIMNDNTTPYYSNPRVYTPDYGIAMGIENQIDAVRAMNERSQLASEFY